MMDSKINTKNQSIIWKCLSMFLVETLPQDLCLSETEIKQAHTHFPAAILKGKNEIEFLLSYLTQHASNTTSI